MATDPKQQQRRENERELQPDPLLKEGRSRRAWVWTVGIAILAAIVVTLLATSYNYGNNQQVSRFTTGASNEPPRTPVPAGRQSSSSPKEGTYHTVR